MSNIKLASVFPFSQELGPRVFTSFKHSGAFKQMFPYLDQLLKFHSALTCTDIIIERSSQFSQGTKFVFCFKSYCLFSTLS